MKTLNPMNPKNVGVQKRIAVEYKTGTAFDCTIPASGYYNIPMDKHPSSPEGAVLKISFIHYYSSINPPSAISIAPTSDYIYGTPSTIISNLIIGALFFVETD